MSYVLLLLQKYLTALELQEIIIISAGFSAALNTVA
jgi:hypothetical protein